MKAYPLISALIITVLLPLSIHANTFCVSDATGLQTALTTASGNGEDDTVQIEQGTYVGSFIYASTEAFNLTVEGGYTGSCSSQVVDPTNTVLDANETGSVLVLSSPGVAADFVVDGVTIKNGKVEVAHGGGLFVATDNGSLTITNNMISNNFVDNNNYGGGIYVEDTETVILDNNRIMNNSARSGGGIAIWWYCKTIILTNNTFSNNNGTSSGGGITIITANTEKVEIVNNFINHNSSDNGGGIHIGIAGGQISLINNTITNNTNSSSPNGTGGGISISARDIINLINNTITNNSVGTGYIGGVYLILDADSTVANIYNNIIWNNSGAPGVDLYISNDSNNNYLPSPVFLLNNDFDQSADGIYIQLPFTIDPSNLDNEDPLFVDALNGDYHLTGLSPCIDTGRLAGAPPDDMDGHSRPQGDGVDIGADEYIPPDADDDGVPNDEDNCPTDANPDQTDTDHDCIGDVCDDFPNDYDPTVPDSDGDGVGNDCDVCPYDFDDDIDADGLCGNEDNCPDVPNGSDLGTCVNTATNAVGTTCMNDGECDTGETCSNNQEDTDNDGSGDACDSGTLCRGLADFDQDVDAYDLTMFLSHFGRGFYDNPCPPDGPSPVPQTGQTTSYATGDDGDLERGVALVTPRFTDNGDGTVTDNQTGLMWTKEANCFEMQDWNPAITVCSVLASGSCGLTDSSNVGDWRLSNAKELVSLIDFNNHTPALPTGHPFENVQSHDYWSSTTRSYNTGDAWYVHMGNGNIYDANKISNGYVWCVRGGH